MNHAYTVSTQFVVEVVNAFNRIELKGKTPGQPLTLDSDKERIPLTEFCSLLAAMEAATDNPHIGLLLGQHMEPACFTVLGHLVMASNTVGEALEYVAQLQPLIIDCADSQCEVGKESVSFSWNPRIEIPLAKKPLIDLVLSATRHFGIWATGISEPFLAVDFQYPIATQSTAIPQGEINDTIFGHTGNFARKSNRFTIPHSWYHRPIRSANNDLKPIIYHRAEQILAGIQTSKDIIARLKTILENLLPTGYATIENAAAELHLSPRTLQRYLHHQNTNFSQVLQQVRIAQANYLLQHTRLSLTEIAQQVGYREQSSFSNAYKSWTGFPPKQLRLKGTG